MIVWHRVRKKRLVEESFLSLRRTIVEVQKVLFLIGRGTMIFVFSAWFGGGRMVSGAVVVVKVSFLDDP